MARHKLNDLNKNVPHVVTYVILFVLFLLAVLLVQRMQYVGGFLGGF